MSKQVLITTFYDNKYDTEKHPACTVTLVTADKFVEQAKEHGDLPDGFIDDDIVPDGSQTTQHRLTLEKIRDVLRNLTAFIFDETLDNDQKFPRMANFGITFVTNIPSASKAIQNHAVQAIRRSLSPNYRHLDFASFTENVLNKGYLDEFLANRDVVLEIIEIGSRYYKEMMLYLADGSPVPEIAIRAAAVKAANDPTIKKLGQRARKLALNAVGIANYRNVKTAKLSA